MSSDALPITPSAFAAALESLPLSTLHFKAAELRNSLAHLEYSNAQLELFAHPSGEETDSVCIEAIDENIVVMAQMRERLGLLKEEAEKRGVGWGELVGQDGIDQMDGQAEGRGGALMNGTAPRISREGNSVSPERELTAHENEDLSNLQRENTRYGRRDSTETVEEQPAQRHSAWTDGTFQTGRVTSGDLVMDDTSNSVHAARQSSANGINGTHTNGANGINGTHINGANGTNATQGGRLSDEELRRRMEERLSAEEDGSMHL